MRDARTPQTAFRRTLFRLGMLFLGVLVVYLLAFVRSMHQVDAFCARVTTDTDVGELPAIARAVGGVRLSGPTMVDGRVRAAVANPMTMDDYACTVGAASMSGKVETKRLGY